MDKAREIVEFLKSTRDREERFWRKAKESKHEHNSRVRLMMLNELVEAAERIVGDRPTAQIFYNDSKKR